MKLALSLAERSTCRRLKVGAVITSPNWRSVYSVGYNGNASGLPNDCDSEEPGKCGCIHAESNAVINCDVPRGMTKVVFTTHLPCTNCFLPGTLASSLVPIKRAYKRWYEGTVLRVITGHGDFTVTPNHPILTRGRGWVAAELLHKGDYLLCSNREQGVSPSTSDHNQSQPIEQIFQSLMRSGVSVRSPGASHQFHGDGIPNEDVDVVSINSPLKDDGQSCLHHLFKKPLFSSTRTSGVSFILQSTGDVYPNIMRGTAHSSFTQSSVDDISVNIKLLRQRVDRSAHLVGSYNFLCRQDAPSLSKALGSDLSLFAKDPEWAQSVKNSGTGYTKISSQSLRGLSPIIAMDEIIQIERNSWTGHVFNLETENGWYCVGPSNIIAHNCAKILINLGNVIQIYYLNDYRIKDSLALFKTVGIRAEQMHLSGAT